MDKQIMHFISDYISSYDNAKNIIADNYKPESLRKEYNELIDVL